MPRKSTAAMRQDEADRKESLQYRADERPAVAVKLTKLDRGVPDPVELQPGLFELKLWAGDKDKYLLQNARRGFTTKLALELPPGHVMTLWPGAGMVDTPDTRSPTLVEIDPGSLVVRESVPELKVVLRNFGYGAHHPADWEFSIVALVTELAPISLEVGMTDEVKAAIARADEVAQAAA